jgi:hypothetical protein
MFFVLLLLDLLPRSVLQAGTVPLGSAVSVAETHAAGDHRLLPTVLLQCSRAWHNCQVGASEGPWHDCKSSGGDASLLLCGGKSKILRVLLNLVVCSCDMVGCAVKMLTAALSTTDPDQDHAWGVPGVTSGTCLMQ